MFQTNYARRVLIVAPKTILGVWQEEFAKYAAFDYELTILTGSTEKKAEMLKTPISLPTLERCSSCR